MATDTSLPRIEIKPEFADILREREFYAETGDDSASEQLNSSFDALLLQSGLELAPAMLLFICMCTSIAVGGLTFVIQENLLTTALGVAVGLVLPIVVVAILRNHRQATIMRQMPEMVNELARASKTGRSLEQCFSLVAEDTPAPLGDELRLCQQKMELGLSLSSALEQLPQRTGLISLNVFVMALSVHQQTGGNLVTVLDRLSQTIRDRINFLGRLRSATAASRAAALLMIGVPPATIAFFVFRDPTYLSRLMESSWGRNITFAAIVLQVIGAFWVLRVLKSSQRT